MNDPKDESHPLAGLFALTGIPLTQPEPALPTRITRPGLTEAIAAALYQVSANELEGVCIGFGLDPAGANDDPYKSKKGYVRKLLTQKTLPELIDLGMRVNDDYETPTLTHLISLSSARGVNGQLRNIIFAANGPKPKIVLTDALNNTIEIKENAQFCLVYDRPLDAGGLTWAQLVDWWRGQGNWGGAEDRTVGLNLYDRLQASLQGNVVEELLFRTYAGLYGTRGFDVPALIPQVYLHYDPYTRFAGGTLPRQRMDFLLLLPGRRRIVLEVDGKQHYSANNVARPDLYAEMVAEDRKLRLARYEVYRFGGKELMDAGAVPMLQEFFSRLLESD